MKTKVIKGQFCAKTDIGNVRVTNEDQAFCLINPEGNVLLCVCDGMGGHNKGDYASNLAANIISEEFRKVNGFLSHLSLRMWVSRTLKKVNTQIYKEAEDDVIYKDMGTTLVMAILWKDEVHVINVGDSRAYFKKYASMKQLTEDQTYVDYLYKTGKISEDEMKTHKDRHVLMNAIGTFPSVSYTYNIYPNVKDPILLCSDGLYNNASEAEIHSVLSTNERVDQKVNSLIEVAKSNGGSDNIAIAYWEPNDDKDW